MSIKEWETYLTTFQIPLFAIVVAKTGFKNKVFQILEEKFDKIEKEKLYINNNNMEDIYNRLGTHSLFASQKIYFINGIKNITKGEREILFSVINKKTQDRYVFVIMEEEDKNIYKALNLDVLIKEPNNTDDIIRGLEEEYNIDFIDAKIRSIIKEWTGAKPFLLRQLFEKISALPSGTLLTEEEIVDLIGEGGQKQLYELTNSIVEKRLEKSLKILHNLLNWGIDIYTIISMIRSMWIRLLLISVLSQENIHSEKIAFIIGRKKWYVSKTLQLIKYDRERIIQGILTVYDTERLLRMSVDKNLLLENLIYELCSK